MMTSPHWKRFVQVTALTLREKLLINLVPSLALDANILIHILRGVGRVQQRLSETDPAILGIPAAALYEVEYGTLLSANSQVRRRALHGMIGALTVLPFDAKAAGRTAQLCIELEKRSQTIRPTDLMIAGTALAFGRRLVTHNTAEFSRVRGLELEDWY